MKSIMKSNRLQIIVVTLGIVTFLALFAFANIGTENLNIESLGFTEHNTGRIINLLNDNTEIDEASGVRFGRMDFEVEMTRGPHTGERFEASYILVNQATVPLDVGDRVSVLINFQIVPSMDDDSEFDEILTVEIRGPERTEIMVGFILFFLLVLCLIGGKRGVMSVLGLLFSLFSIMFILVPLVLQGYNAILVSIIIITLTTIVNLTLLAGVTPKSISAMLGCLIGILFAAFFAWLVGGFVHINGHNMEDVGTLIHFAPNADISGLFISSVLIATIGAVMDTAISIASAVEEIRLASPNISTRKLFEAGMNVGRDIMGTMSDTLILAFAGTALNLVLIINATDTSFNQFINNNFIAVEIIRGVAGSLGIILTAPAVAYIAAKLLNSNKQ